MKQAMRLVLVLGLVAGAGCVRRLPPGEVLAERFLVGAPVLAEALVPLRVETMIGPGLVPVRCELNDEKNLVAIFFVDWKPVASPEFAAEQILAVIGEMFVSRIFLPSWSEEVGLDETLEAADERLNWLVNSRLKVMKLDTVVELELILVQVSVAATGEARYTWIERTPPE